MAVEETSKQEGVMVFTTREHPGCRGLVSFRRQISRHSPCPILDCPLEVSFMIQEEKEECFPNQNMKDHTLSRFKKGASGT